MLADQDVVPDAAPEPPVELLHLTAVTAALSAATPLMATVDAVVERIVAPGDLICKEGGVVSPAPEGGPGVGGATGGGVGVGAGVGAGVGTGAGTLLP